MKLRNLSVAASLVLAILVCCAPSVWSQTYQVIYDFNGSSGGVSIGANPSAPLLFDSQGNLYGTAVKGGFLNFDDCGQGGCGTVFELFPNQHGGWSGKLLRAFHGNGSDSGFPPAPVVFDRRGNLYGTTNCTLDCASNLGGVVFQLTPMPNGFWTETILDGLSGHVCLGGFLGSGGILVCSVAFDRTGHLYGVTVGGGAFAGQSGRTH